MALATDSSAPTAPGAPPPAQPRELFKGVPITDDPTLRATLEGCAKGLERQPDLEAYFTCMEPYRRGPRLAVFGPVERDGGDYFFVDNNRDGRPSYWEWGAPISGFFWPSRMVPVPVRQGGRIVAGVARAPGDKTYAVNVRGALYRIDPRDDLFRNASPAGFVDQTTVDFDVLVKRYALQAVVIDALLAMPVEDQSAVVGDLTETFLGVNLVATNGSNHFRNSWKEIIDAEAKAPPDQKKEMPRVRMMMAFKRLMPAFLGTPLPELLRKTGEVFRRHGIPLDLTTLASWDFQASPERGLSADLSLPQEPERGVPKEKEPPLAGFVPAAAVRDQAGIDWLTSAHKSREAALIALDDQDAARLWNAQGVIEGALIGTIGFTGLDGVYLQEEVGLPQGFPDYEKAELWARNLHGSSAILREVIEGRVAYRVYRLDEEIEEDDRVDLIPLPGPAGETYRVVSVVTSETRLFDDELVAERLADQIGKDEDQIRAALRGELPHGSVLYLPRPVLFADGEGREVSGKVKPHDPDEPLKKDPEAAASFSAEVRNVHRRLVLERALGIARTKKDPREILALRQDTLRQATVAERAEMIELLLANGNDEESRHFITALFQTIPATAEDFDLARWYQVHPDVVGTLMAPSKEEAEAGVDSPNLQRERAAQRRGQLAGTDFLFRIGGSIKDIDDLAEDEQFLQKYGGEAAEVARKGGVLPDEKEFSLDMFMASWNNFSKGAGVDALVGRLRERGQWEELNDRFGFEERLEFLTMLRDLGMRPMADFGSGLSTGGTGFFDSAEWRNIGAMARAVPSLARSVVRLTLWVPMFAWDLVTDPIDGEPGQIVALAGGALAGGWLFIKGTYLGDKEAQAMVERIVAAGVGAVRRHADTLIETGNSRTLLFDYPVRAAIEIPLFLRLRYLNEVMGWIPRAVRTAVAVPFRLRTRFAALRAPLVTESLPGLRTRLNHGIRLPVGPWVKFQVAGGFGDAQEVDTFVTGMSGQKLIGETLGQAGRILGNRHLKVRFGDRDAMMPDLQMLKRVGGRKPTEAALRIKSAYEIEERLARMDRIAETLAEREAAAASLGRGARARASWDSWMLRREANELADEAVVLYNRATNGLLPSPAVLKAARGVSQWYRRATNGTARVNGREGRPVRIAWLARGASHVFGWAGWAGERIGRVRNRIGGEVRPGEAVASRAPGQALAVYDAELAGAAEAAARSPLLLNARARRILVDAVEANRDLVAEYGGWSQARHGRGRVWPKLFGEPGPSIVSGDFWRGPHRAIPAEPRAAIDPAVAKLLGSTREFERILERYDGRFWSINPLRTARKVHGRLFNRRYHLSEPQALELMEAYGQMATDQMKVQAAIREGLGFRTPRSMNPEAAWARNSWESAFERPKAAAGAARQSRRRAGRAMAVSDGTPPIDAAQLAAARLRLGIPGRTRLTRELLEDYFWVAGAKASPANPRNYYRQEEAAEEFEEVIRAYMLLLQSLQSAPRARAAS